MNIEVDLLNDSILVRVDIDDNTLFFGIDEVDSVKAVLEFWYIANGGQDDNLAQLIKDISNLEQQ